MNTKVLCVTVIFFTFLIFLGNHSAARNEAEPVAACTPCNCKVEMLQMYRKKVKEPTCSVVFTMPGKMSNWRQTISAPATTIDTAIEVSECDFAVFCDVTHLAAVYCDITGSQSVAVEPGQKCTFQCRNGLIYWNCDNWQRKQKKKKRSGSLDSPGPPSWIVLASTKISGPTTSGFGPGNYGQDAEDAQDIITGSVRWRLIDGEAGMEKGELTVASGQAEAQSFCTGDTIQLTGPGVVSLPTCPVDITGRWQGDYTRRPLKKEPLAVILDLRMESYALRGELKTPDGTFNITSARQNDTGLQLEASGMVGGAERKFSLNGKLTKGDIVLDGIETGIAEKPIRLIGAVKRLYIADSGVPPAVLNQPYSFTLTGVSPDEGATTFRMAGGRLPRGIAFDASSGSFSGTPVEPGVFKIVVAAADAAGNVFEQPLALSVKNLVITNRLLPDAFIGRPYSAALKVAGGRAPYRFSGFAPKGLTLDPNTGELSGIPTSNRHEPSQFTIRDSQNNSETQDVSLHVRRTTILTSHFLAEAMQGSPYRMQFKGVGNNIATQWLMSGEDGVELIKSIGLTLNPQTGELSGTPTMAGEFWLSVGAVTTSADQQYRNFTLAIKQGGKSR